MTDIKVMAVKGIPPFLYNKLDIHPQTKAPWWWLWLPAPHAMGLGRGATHLCVWSADTWIWAVEPVEH